MIDPSEVSPAERARTIKLGRAVAKQLLERQFFPLMREYAQWMKERRKLAELQGYRPQRQQQIEPQEDSPEQQAALREVLEEATRGRK